MAKEEKKQLTPEEKKREKERLEKEAQENKEIENLKKEKEKKQKRKQLRAKKKQKEEIKRIKNLINLPFKLHLQISLLITLFAFIIIFFWIELDVQRTLLYTFFIFSILYFGVGLIMVSTIFLISEDKKKELEEMRRLEAEIKADEEKQREDEELAKLEEIERDIAAKRYGDTAKELPSSNTDFVENSDEIGFDLDGNPKILEENVSSLEGLNFEDSNDSDMNFIDNNMLEQELSKSKTDSEDSDTSYLQEILGNEPK